MKKFTEKQILEGFRMWEQSVRDTPEEFMSCYEVFCRSVDKIANGQLKALLKYIKKANA